MKEIKSVAIVHVLKEEAISTAKDIQAFLAEKNVVSTFFPSDMGEVSEKIVKNDLVITLGGDGTVLSSARFCAKNDIEILPINFGKFGFIASVQKNAWKTILEQYIQEGTSISERSLIHVCVMRDSKKVFSSVGLNECVVSGSGIATIVALDLSLDGIPFGQYQADGIIVATPTGSTAYSAAAGGPIIDPELSAFVINPVCAFSLSSRPLVVPDTGKIAITVLPNQRTSTVLSIDGQVFFDLNESDQVFIQKYEQPIKLIGCNKAVFYEALRSKLAWSGSYHNGGNNA